MFDPKFYLLVQGEKQLRIGGRSLRFKTGSCAVSSVSLPFSTQTLVASRDLPYVGLELKLDTGAVSDLLLGMSPTEDESIRSFSAAQVTGDVIDPINRLLSLLRQPQDIKTLAPLCERELYYRLLQGPMGGTLRQVVQSGTRFQQIKAAVESICATPFARLCVPKLAAQVGMSVTSFHRHFKAVTACSPLVYQRQLRMLEARRLLASGTVDVTNVAFETGYTSASQFSREYKRLFGVSPVEHTPRRKTRRTLESMGSHAASTLPELYPE